MPLSFGSLFTKLPFLCIWSSYFKLCSCSPDFSFERDEKLGVLLNDVSLFVLDKVLIELASISVTSIFGALCTKRKTSLLTRGKVTAWASSDFLLLQSMVSVVSSIVKVIGLAHRVVKSVLVGDCGTLFFDARLEHRKSSSPPDDCVSYHFLRLSATLQVFALYELQEDSCESCLVKHRVSLLKSGCINGRTSSSPEARIVSRTLFSRPTVTKSTTIPTTTTTVPMILNLSLCVQNMVPSLMVLIVDPNSITMPKTMATMVTA